jgi:hypothetical protein
MRRLRQILRVCMDRYTHACVGVARKAAESKSRQILNIQTHVYRWCPQMPGGVSVRKPIFFFSEILLEREKFIDNQELTERR